MSYTSLSIHFAKVKDKNPIEVGNIIGGKVKVNTDNGTFKNACALKFSYALNRAGYTINKSDGAVSSGADGKWYLYRVPHISKYAKSIAKEELRGSKLSDFKGKKGIIAFGDCDFSDASGHIDLFDGDKVEGKGYFSRCGDIILYVL